MAGAILASVQLPPAGRIKAHAVSAALAMLGTLSKKVKGCDGKLLLCKIRPEIREVFAFTRLDTILDIEVAKAETVVQS